MVRKSETERGLLVPFAVVAVDIVVRDDDGENDNEEVVKVRCKSEKLSGQLESFLLTTWKMIT